MRIKRILIRSFPFLISSIAGIILYFSAGKTANNLNSIIISLSATLFAIPIIYIFYQFFVSLSEKRLRKEIYDYSKMLIDTEVLAVLNQLGKFLYPNYEFQLNPKSIKNICELSKQDLVKIISRGEYLGFQAKKNWEYSIKTISEKIQNNQIINKMDTDLLCIIISFLKSINSFEIFIKRVDYLERTEKKTDEYNIVSGKELNPVENKELPDRLILLKKLDSDKGVVVDFGDFKKHQSKDLLNYYKVKNEWINLLSEIINDVIMNIKEWIYNTGYEFIIDEQLFKPIIK
ncbi:MAG: hypothetical protein NTW93_01505 [Phycisphaerae bacterium]|nr:hypothetical protein [Phycisphaerae bacterium]